MTSFWYYAIKTVLFILGLALGCFTYDGLQLSGCGIRGPIQ